MSPGWDPIVRHRADKAHARKKAARKQRRHLEAIKSERALREMMLRSRQRQK